MVHYTIYHIFLYAIRRSVRSISVPRANNRLSGPASMTSLWHVSKHDMAINSGRTP